MATDTARTARAGPGRGRRLRAWALFVVAVAAGSALINPYLLLDIESSRLEVTGELHYGLLVTHVVTAMIALTLGPLQFVPEIRARRHWHRQIGRAYLILGVVPSALAGIPVAMLSGRLITQVGLVIPAIGWLVTAWLAIRAIRRRDVEAHRSWMTRSYALTFLAVTSRILVPLMVLAQLPFGGPDGRAQRIRARSDLDRARAGLGRQPDHRGDHHQVPPGAKAQRAAMTTTYDESRPNGDVRQRPRRSVVLQLAHTSKGTS